MDVLFIVLGLLVFVGLVYLGVTAVISIAWSIGWLLVAVVIALILFEVISAGIGFWSLVIIVLIVLLLLYFL